MSFDYIIDDKEIFQIHKNLEFIKNHKTKIPNIIINGTPGNCQEDVLYNYLGIKKFSKKIKTFVSSAIRNYELIYYIYENFYNIDIKNFGAYKEILLKSFLLDIISTKTFDKKIKTIIIHNFQLLKPQEQYVLRKIMEDNMDKVSFIILTHNLNRIIKPLLSRFIMIKTNDIEKTDIIQKIKMEEEKIQKSLTNEEYCHYLLQELFNSSLIDVKKINKESILVEYEKIVSFLNEKKCSYKKLSKTINYIYINYNQTSDDIMYDIYNLYFRDDEDYLNLMFDISSENKKEDNKSVVYLEYFFITLKNIKDKIESN
jgi:DNA polymerase III delta prime subunit